jgi:hypothetical protein
LNRHVQAVINQILSVAPMPPEAYPGGVVGKVPAIRSLSELAWQNMAMTMFTAGLVAGVLLAVLFFVAVVMKASIPAVMKAVANVPH